MEPPDKAQDHNESSKKHSDSQVQNDDNYSSNYTAQASPQNNEAWFSSSLKLSFIMIDTANIMILLNVLTIVFRSQ